MALETTIACARCGERNPRDARFCIICGNTISQTPAVGPTTKLQTKACTACQTPNPENAQFCLSCGRTLKEEAPTPRPTMTQTPPQRVFPRVNTPPVYVPQQRRRGTFLSGQELMIGIFAAIVVTSLIAGSRGFPFMFFLLPLGLLGSALRGHRFGKWVPWIGILALLLLAIKGMVWPVFAGLGILWLVFHR